MNKNTCYQQKKIPLKGNVLTQNEKLQILNLKAKLKYKKWFVLDDNCIKKKFMTREKEFYYQLYQSNVFGKND